MQKNETKTAAPWSTKCRVNAEKIIHPPEDEHKRSSEAEEHAVAGLADLTELFYFGNSRLKGWNTPNMLQKNK
jgi:hypothetical protein